MANGSTAKGQPTPHRWRFHRIGGLDQVYLESADDLRNLTHLDQKLWVALGCPTKGLEIDARTLELLDLDHDGRVRAPEVIGAVQWCDQRLADLGALVPGKDVLALAELSTATPEGRALLGAARQVLASLGKPEATAVTPADVADTTKVFAGTAFNGDGVVTPESAADPGVRQIVEDALACAGGVPDRSGKPGVDQGRVDAFHADLVAFDAWWKKGQVADVMVFGAGTPAAYDAVHAAGAKLDDFFTRVGLAAIDARIPPLLGRPEAEIAAMSGKDLSSASAEVATLPLARVEGGRPLPLAEGVNPAWTGAIAALQRDAVAPLLGPGRASLTAAEWAQLKAKLAPYQAWMAEKKGTAVERLGVPRVEALLAGDAKGVLESLIAKDKEKEAEALAVADVVRMVHYRRDLHRLLQNFVNFADFYDPRLPAIFQAGTLYLDGRSCHLCVKVDDPAAHAALAGPSRLFIAYCECRRPGESMKVAACFTQGDSDYLSVGRNGLFYDRKGRDWDATIVRIADNPISIRQAFWSPYKKFARMIEEQVTKFAAAKDKESEAKMGSAAQGLTGAATGQKPPAKAEPVDVGRMVGIIAALGVGAGAVGTLFGGFVSGFMGLQPWWAKIVAVAGIFLAISGPSMLLAALKLRQRNLGPVLDANGWAINGRVKVNLPLGTALTDRAVLPPGSSRSLQDPFVDEAARSRRTLAWTLLVALAAALAAARYLGKWPFVR